MPLHRQHRRQRLRRRLQCGLRRRLAHPYPRLRLLCCPRRLRLRHRRRLGKRNQRSIIEDHRRLLRRSRKTTYVWLIYKLSNFTRQREAIKEWCDYRKDVKDGDLITELSHRTAVPLLPMCYLVAEVRGWSDEINHKIAYLSKFYKDTVEDDTK